MKRSWYIKTGICCLPGLILAVTAYSNDSPTGCAGDERFPDLGQFLLSPLLMMQKVLSEELFELLIMEIFEGFGGAVLVYGTFMAGSVVLAWSGIKTKYVSPAALGLLAFSGGLYWLRVSQHKFFCCG